MNQREFRKALFRVLVFPLVSALALALLISWQVKALLDMTTWVDRSQQVISQSHRLQKLLMDMEAGVRGYALTGSPRYLQPYEEARIELSSALTKLQRLVDDQPLERTRIRKVEALSQEWIVRYADVTIHRIRQGQRAYRPDIGAGMMNEMREEFTQLIQVATALREERVERAQTMARVLSGGGVLLAISVGLFLAMSARRQLFHLTELYQTSLNERNRLLDAEREAVRARDEFLSIASHELKTPLTSLRLQVQLLEKSVERRAEPEKVSGHVAQSLKSIDRITHLVDDMLDISRITANRLVLHREVFDLALLTREVVDRLTPLAAQSGMRLSLTATGPARGEWDRFRIDQVITNLISNAVKYGGREPIEVRVLVDGNRAVLEVQDRGIGISPTDHERIFQRFERVSSAESVSGMGLGLYITREIVGMHGGRLDVESELGKGALFRVRLPMS